MTSSEAKKCSLCPGQSGSVSWTTIPTPKGCRFDSGSVHLSRLWVGSPVRVETNWSLPLSLSLSLPPSSLSKINNKSILGWRLKFKTNMLVVVSTITMAWKFLTFRESQERKYSTLVNHCRRCFIILIFILVEVII